MQSRKETTLPLPDQSGPILKPSPSYKVATLLGERGIGISSVMQPEELGSEHTSLVLMLDDATLACIQEAIGLIANLDCVREAPVWLRVETMEG